MNDFLTEPMRALQDRFETRNLADRVWERAFREQFTEADRGFINNAVFFFIATADATGRPQCSYKGGPRGFVRVTGPAEVSFQIFEGNGLYLTAGNMIQTAKVDLLFVDFENQCRLRVNGQATIDENHPVLKQVKAAQLVARVQVETIHPNCMRHVHKMTMEETSEYTPASDGEDVGKAPWGDAFSDVLPDYMKPD